MERYESSSDHQAVEEIEQTDSDRRAERDEREYLRERIKQHRKETLPRRDRPVFSVTNHDGSPIASVESTHAWRYRVQEEWRAGTDAEMGYVGEPSLWVVVDFDDVLNRTTEYQNFLKDKFSEIGLPDGEFERLYHETKKVGAAGKEEFDYFAFIEKIKSSLPDKGEEIDGMLHNVEYKKFLDQSLLRTLEVIQAEQQPVKVSLLTYGDPAYQKMRIDATDIDKVVDEIIYTEGSKKEVLDRMREKSFDPDVDPDKVRLEDQAFIITVDDSPEHTEDYGKLSLKRQYANIRYRHPSAKRYDAETKGKEVIELDEDSPSNAALNIYRAAVIGQRLSNFWVAWENERKEPSLPNFHDSRKNTRARVFSALKDSTKYPEILSKLDELRHLAVNEEYIVSGGRSKKHKK